MTSQKYGNRDIPSLPKLLEKNGYETATLHTNVKTFYNRAELYKGLGFNRVYDKAYFGQHKVLVFGDVDELLFKNSFKALDDIQKTGKPFYAQYITMSSHFPFQLPQNMKDMKLPAKYDNSLVGNYIDATHYADKALGTFIDELKKKGLWDNTVFVVYGDHFGINSDVITPKDNALMKGLLNRDYTKTDMMNIPLVIHVPGQNPQTLHNVGGQVDTMPTVLNLLGINMGNQVHFGEDLLNNTSNVLPERFYTPNGSFINDKDLVIPGNTVTSGTAINVQTRLPEKVSSAYQNDYDNALKLLQLSDRYLENLPVRK
jgi:phosphoglycerol transferase MdoB-like AlkP superfamily enzyme